MQKPLPLLTLVLGMSLFSFRIGSSPILVSDVALAIAVLFSFTSRFQLCANAPSIFAVLLLIAAGLSGFAHLISSTPHFAEADFLLSFARLSFVVLAVLTLPHAFARIDPIRLGEALITVLRIHVVALIAIEVLLALFGWDVATAFQLPSTRQTYWGLGVRRASGLFTEPSFFAIYTALTMFTLLGIETAFRSQLVSLTDLALLGIATALTASLTGFVVFAVVCAARIRLMISGRSLAIFVVSASIAVGIAILAATQLTQLSEELASYVQERLIALTIGDDSSANDRIVGSWEVTNLAANKHPLTGIGLGQEQSFIARNANLFLYKARGDNEGHVSILNVLTTLGFPGAVAFGLILASFLIQRGTRHFGVGLVLVTIAWGSFLSSILWFFMGMVLGMKISVPSPRALVED